MAFINTQQRADIEAAIREAEARTSGEFVAVVARESDDYLYIPLLWAALCALIVPALLLMLPWWHGDPSLYQLATFIVAAALFRWPWLKMRLIPGYVKQRRAALVAREQFLHQGLHHTEGRNGILLFVSVAERYVEILADQKVNQVVDAGTWDALIDDFIKEVRSGQVEQGFIHTIERCGTILQQHFPVAEKDVNELPNHLIVLE